MLLLGVGLSFAAVPFLKLPFASAEVGLAKLEELIAFAILTLVETIAAGDVRDIFPGAVEFGKLVLLSATNNPGVHEVATLVTLFPD